MENDLPYRPNVCLLIANQNRKLFLGERLGSPGVWQLPQGGVEAGASERESALREACEELGVSEQLLRVVQKLSATHTYDFRTPPAYATGRWRGQSQTFWLLEFSGRDSDIDLARHDPEFENFCWCTPDEVIERAEPVRVPGYRQPVEEVKQLLSQL